MCLQHNNTNLTQNNQSNQDGLGNLLNKMAAWILFLCVAVSAISIAFFSFGRAILDDDSEVKISYVFQTDTIGVVSSQSRALADSVLNEMSKHEQRIADKYEYIIEQRSNMEDYLTWGGILLTVVISVFGFFGYKSLHDIQERIVKLVEPSAQKAAEDKAEAVCGSKYVAYETQTEAKINAWKTNAKSEMSSFQSSTLTTMKEELTQSVGKKIARQKQVLDEQIRSKVVEMYDQRFADKVQDIENNAEVINNIQKEITSLKNRIDELEGKLPTSSTHKPDYADKKKPRLSLRTIDPDPMNPKKS